MAIPKQNDFTFLIGSKVMNVVKKMVQTALKSAEFATNVLNELKADQTCPEANNLRQGWTGNDLLREIEGLAQDHGLFEEWAIFGDNVRGLTKEPLIRVHVLVGAIIPGTRMAPNAHREDVDGLLNLARVEVDALPDKDTRKTRLDSLLKYHKSTWNTHCDDYAGAADQYERDAVAQEKSGDTGSAQISRYCSAYTRIYLAVTDGDTEKYNTLHKELVSTAGIIVEGIGSETTGEAVRWAYLNVPSAVIESMMLTDTQNPDDTKDWLTILDNLEKVNPELYSEWLPSIEISQAAAAMLSGDLELACEKAQASLDKNSYPSVQARAHLILARAGDPSHYQALIDGGHKAVYRALAERELAD